MYICRNAYWKTAVSWEERCSSTGPYNRFAWDSIRCICFQGNNSISTKCLLVNSDKSTRFKLGPRARSTLSQMEIKKKKDYIEGLKFSTLIRLNYVVLMVSLLK